MSLDGVPMAGRGFLKVRINEQNASLKKLSRVRVGEAPIAVKREKKL